MLDPVVPTPFIDGVAQAAGAAAETNVATTADPAMLIEARRLQYTYGPQSLVKLEWYQELEPCDDDESFWHFLWLSISMVAIIIAAAGFVITLNSMMSNEAYLSSLLISSGSVIFGAPGFIKLVGISRENKAFMENLPTVPESVRDAWLRIKHVASEAENDTHAPSDILQAPALAWDVVREISAHAAAGGLDSKEAEGSKQALYRAAAQLDTYALLRRSSRDAEPSDSARLLEGLDIVEPLRLLTTGKETGGEATAASVS